MDQFFLSADFGKSNCKFAYLDPAGEPQVLMLSPYIAKLATLGSAPPRLAEDERPNLEESWVGDLDNYYVLGRLAQVNYWADARLEDRKYESGIYKLLGAIGYLSQIGMIQDGATINLALLLPFSEYRDAELIWELLEPTLNRFVYCGLIKEFALGTHKVYPEGAGLFSRGLSDSVNASQFKIGVLMSGHYNQSWLRCDYGKVNDMGSHTNDLGFNRLVSQVAKAACIQERQWPLLTQQLYDAGQLEDRLERTKTDEGAVKLKEDLFGSLLQAQDSRLRARERDRLVDAVISCRRQYWSQVQDWLRRRSSEVDFVLFCGGSAYYLRRELKKQWPKAQWGERLLQFTQSMILVRQSEVHLCLDVLGILLFLLPEEMEQEVFAKHEAVAKDEDEPVLVESGAQ